ncbi:MAG: hypothetical protein PHP83_01650 [Clostridia bacterium]|nr:hypothetical protein [Clostridia bacterium]
MNIKDILNKPVLSLYEGELIGIIDTIWFDKKLKNLVAIELVSEDNLRFVVHTKNIYHVGKNAVTIKNTDHADLKENLEPFDYVKNPIGNKVYTINGELKGVIHNIELNDKFLITKVNLDKDIEIDLAKIANCSKNTILIYDENTTINVNKFKFLAKPKKMKTKKDINVTTLPIISEPEQADDEERKHIVLPIPTLTNEQKIVNNTSFILGRKVNKDIFGLNNDIIVKKNTKITQQIIKNASRFGKLKELMIFSE